MRFRVHCANSETGEEYGWEIECATIQEAELRAIEAGMLVSKIVLISDAQQAQPPIQPVTRMHNRGYKRCLVCNEFIYWYSRNCLHCKAKQPLLAPRDKIAIGALMGWVAIAMFVFISFELWDTGPNRETRTVPHLQQQPAHPAYERWRMHQIDKYGFSTDTSQERFLRLRRGQIQRDKLVNELRELKIELEGGISDKELLDGD